LKLGDRKEDSEKQPISFRLREAMIGLRLGDALRDLVGETAEYIVCAMLGTLGIRCERRHICLECKHQNMPEYTDLVAYRPLKRPENPVEVPVQVKSCSRKKHGWEIRIDDFPLKTFKGFYIILFEYEPDDILLFIKSDRMKKLMRKYGKMEPGKARHHKNYWSLLVPRNLKGFKQYLKKDKFIEAVLDAPYRDASVEK